MSGVTEDQPRAAGPHLYRHLAVSPEAMRSGATELLAHAVGRALGDLAEHEAFDREQHAATLGLRARDEGARRIEGEAAVRSAEVMGFPPDAVELLAHAGGLPEWTQCGFPMGSRREPGMADWLSHAQSVDVTPVGLRLMGRGVVRTLATVAGIGGLEPVWETLRLRIEPSRWYQGGAVMPTPWVLIGWVLAPKRQRARVVDGRR